MGIRVLARTVGPGSVNTEMLASTTTLNRVGATLAKHPAVHAITDVTGFGLLGHALEMARGSGLSLVIGADDLPLLREAVPLLRQGVVTGASGRNWASYGASVTLPAEFPDWRRNLLTEYFYLRGGRIEAIYAAMYYLPPDAADGTGW